MATLRCFVGQIPSTGSTAWLDRDEARHAMGSRRLEAGDAVELVDGNGHVARAVIADARGAAGEVGVRVESVAAHPKPLPEIHVAAALPKGDRLATMLDMLGQLSIASFTPLECRRSVVSADRFDAARAARIFIEAMKQSRGAWMAQVRAARTPKSCLEECLAKKIPALLAHPDGQPIARIQSPQPCCMILIGPEGGFTDEEAAAADAAQAARISLGAATLRIEAAAAMAAGFLRFSR